MKVWINWIQLGIDIDGEAEEDRSGWGVAISPNGNRIAIGAQNNAANNAGHTRIFEWDGSNWIQLGADIDGEASGDRSGLSVSLSLTGDRVVIGALDNDGGGTNSGHARFFEWDGTNWIQLGVDIDGEAAVMLWKFCINILQW